jgi:uncharacterized protein
MRIVFFGAASELGGQAVAEALDRGHTVTALVSDPECLTMRHTRLTVVAGDVRDPQAVAAVIAGQDAVITCIDDPDLISVGMTNILAGMRAAGVQRIVAVSADGILQEDAEMLRRDASDFPPAFRAISTEYLRAYELLRSSGARWTLACVPTLTSGEGNGGYRAERDYLPEGGTQISQADAALFLLDELESGAFIGSRVGIAE